MINATLAIALFIGLAADPVGGKEGEVYEHDNRSDIHRNIDRDSIVEYSASGDNGGIHGDRPNGRTKNAETGEQAEAVSEPRTQVYEVTAYTAGHESTGKRPGDANYGITASGQRVQAGVTIACPPSMPFGTRLRIEGVGERICQDRGGHIVEGRLDVYMPELQDALDFGRRDVRVTIIKRK